MEEFTLYDEHAQPTNQTAKRYQTIDKPMFIPIVHVWIRVHHEKFLIHKRAKTDDLIPFQWATVSGLVLKDEAPIKAAIRETKEELGIDSSTDVMTHLKTIKTEKGRYRTICFVYEINIDTVPVLTLNKEEVSETMLASLETIYKLIQSNQFWDYPKLLHDEAYFELLEKSPL